MDLSTDGFLPLDARAIDAEVSRLWQQAVDSAAGGLVRASTQTVLVMLLEPTLRERVEAALAQAHAAHPSRVIRVAVGDVEPRAHLAAYCRPPGPGRTPVCWDEIQLEGTRATLSRVMSAARALVIPNLPVYVWWPGDTDLASPLFQQVVEIGDRIIVDSAQFTNPISSLALYADHAEAEHGTISVTDLNWRRLEPWRLLLAQFFDTPEDRRFLNYVESLTIRYEQPLYGAAGGLAAALLVMGWLASRLGWSPPVYMLERAQDVQVLEFDDGGREVRVELRRGSVDSGEGKLTEVRLQARLDTHTASYAVERLEDRARTIAEVDQTRREDEMRLSPGPEDRLLEEELTAYGRDRIYEEAIQLIRALQRRVTPSALAR